MNTKQLYKYPRLNTVLSQNFSDHLLGYIKKAVSGSRGDNTETPFNIYRVFIDLAASPDCATYTGLDILNSEHQMNKQLKLLVGFIYSELEVSHSKKWRTTKAIVQTFEYMAQDCDFKIQPIENNSRRITSDVNNCIALYDIELKDRELLDYYKGWSCFDSDGEELPTYLATTPPDPPPVLIVPEAFLISTVIGISLVSCLSEIIVIEPSINEISHFPM